MTKRSFESISEFNPTPVTKHTKITSNFSMTPPPLSFAKSFFYDDVEKKHHTYIKCAHPHCGNMAVKPPMTFMAARAYERSRRNLNGKDDHQQFSDFMQPTLAGIDKLGLKWLKAYHNPSLKAPNEAKCKGLVDLVCTDGDMYLYASFNRAMESHNKVILNSSLYNTYQSTICDVESDNVEFMPALWSRCSSVSSARWFSSDVPRLVEDENFNDFPTFCYRLNTELPISEKYILRCPRAIDYYQHFWSANKIISGNNRLSNTVREEDRLINIDLGIELLECNFIEKRVYKGRYFNREFCDMFDYFCYERVDSNGYINMDEEYLSLQKRYDDFTQHSYYNRQLYSLKRLNQFRFEDHCLKDIAEKMDVVGYDEDEITPFLAELMDQTAVVQLTPGYVFDYDRKGGKLNVYTINPTIPFQPSTLRTFTCYLASEMHPDTGCYKWATHSIFCSRMCKISCEQNYHDHVHNYNFEFEMYMALPYLIRGTIDREETFSDLLIVTKQVY